MNKDEQKSVVIAVTGGIGSGKSTVAGLIREQGYTVLSSDEKGREITAGNPEIKKKIIAAFGNEAYSDDGNINSQFLASLVFGNSDKHDRNLLKLNSIIHPYVIDYMIAEVQRLEDSGEKLIFVESALTFEANLQDGFDYIIVVDAPDEACIKRVMQRNGMSRQDVKNRMNAQINPVEKRKAADFVINNDKSLDDLKNAVNFILGIVKSLKPKPGTEE